jgi:hypothetical protein
LKAGYEVYFISDASVANTKEAHEMTIQCMIQTGAIPVTTVSSTSEVIRPFGREDNRTPDIATHLHV